MKKQIDLKKTKVYSDFVFDFLNGNEALKNFYNSSFDIKNFKKQIEMKKSFSLSKRNILVKELLSQYSDINDKKVNDAVDVVADAAKKAGISLGIYLPDARSLNQWADRGFSFFIIGSDQSHLKYSISQIINN